MREVPDATYCQLIYYNNNDSIVTTFYLEMLNSDQREIIDKLISLRTSSLTKIKYHYFPDTLLKSKLPEPPPILQ